MTTSSHLCVALLFLTWGFPYLEIFSLCSANTDVRCIESEREALLQFKRSLEDSMGRLSSWDGEECCTWTGISCNNKTQHVVKLNLSAAAVDDGFQSSELQLEMDNQISSSNSVEQGEDVVIIEVNGGVEQQQSAAGRVSMNKKGKKKVKRGKRSQVWEYFDELGEGNDGKERAQCKKCKTVYISDTANGTGTLGKHIKKCHSMLDIGQMLLSKSQESTMAMKSKIFKIEIFREKIMMAIVRHDLPLQFVEYEWIRDAFEYANEEAKLVSRNTAKVDILKIHKNEKAILKSVMQSCPGRICLTSDLWTAINQDAYLSLTAHYIDDEWKLQKRIINFCYMPTPHTGIVLCEKIYNLVSDWEIEKKLFSITLDNCSANDSLANLLMNQLNLRDALVMNGKFFHIRCCAHIMNLIVQDGLKEIDPCVVKIRESIKYLKGYRGRKDKFLGCVEQVSLSPKEGLSQDVPTRWNSTYLMLEKALYYRLAFMRLELCDSNYTYCPSHEEWDRVEKICSFLKVFYKVTCVFSGTKYPTSNLFFPHIVCVERTILDALESTDRFMHNMGREMDIKFEKYWSNYNVIFAIAVVFDPRYKLQFVEYSYKQLFGENSNEFEIANECLYEMFNEYVKAFSKNTNTSEGSQQNNKGKKRLEDEQDDFMEGFDTYENEDSGAGEKSQLDLYLMEKRSPRTEELDILCFWKANQYRYPVLSLLARDVLSIPISTVASESAFSVGGRVIDQYRTALKSDTVEAIVCTRDWLGEKKDHKPSLNDLCEDVFKMHINHEVNQSTQCSNASQ